MNEEQQLEQISDVQDKNGGLEQTQAQGTKEERTYSKEEVTDIVEKRLKREREKMEKEFSKRLDALEEAQKLSQMSEVEKQQFEFDKRLKELEEREQALQEKESAYNKQQYLNEIENQLKSKGLPTDMAELLVSLPAEEVSAKIASMEKSFNTQVNNSIQDRVKASASTPIAPTQEQQGLLSMEQIKAMSTQEILKNKELVDKSLDAIYGQK